jgi:hypothetical protein
LLLIIILSSLPCIYGYKEQFAPYLFQEKNSTYIQYNEK